MISRFCSVLFLKTFRRCALKRLVSLHVSPVPQSQSIARVWCLRRASYFRRCLRGGPQKDSQGLQVSAVLLEQATSYFWEQDASCWTTFNRAHCVNGAPSPKRSYHCYDMTCFRRSCLERGLLILLGVLNASLLGSSSTAWAMCFGSCQHELISRRMFILYNA